jgi:predicted metallopeptidase
MSEKRFVVSEDIKKLADSIIEDKKLDYLNNVRIVYALIYPYVSKTVIAKCIKSSKELEHFGSCDYIIEFSGDLWEKLEDINMKKYVVEHELAHILITTSKKGETKFKILKHNISDFSSTIKDYGLEINQNLKVLAMAVNDVETTDGITL